MTEESCWLVIWMHSYGKNPTVMIKLEKALLIRQITGNYDSSLSNTIKIIFLDKYY